MTSPKSQEEKIDNGQETNESRERPVVENGTAGSDLVYGIDDIPPLPQLLVLSLQVSLTIFTGLCVL